MNQKGRNMVDRTRNPGKSQNYTEPKKPTNFSPLMLITTNYFPLAFQTDFAHFRNGDAFTIPQCKNNLW